MDFAEFVCVKAILPELKAADRDGAIKELICALDEAGELPENSRQRIIKAVIKRENEASTGMGKGVAVPHVKFKEIDRVIAAIGQSGKGIDFSSLDKQPVYSIVLLISPAGDTDKHLEAMEKVFRHLQQEKFRKFLRQCRTTEDVEDLLKEADEGTFL